MAAAAAATAAIGTEQRPPADVQRLALLDDVFNSNIPHTLQRRVPGSESGPSQKNKPPWHSLRGAAAVPNHQAGSEAAGIRAGKLDKHDKQPPGAGTADSGEQVDCVWEAQLPVGLTADKCAGLPQTVSVKQLVEVGGLCQLITRL